MCHHQDLSHRALDAMYLFKQEEKWGLGWGDGKKKEEPTTKRAFFDSEIITPSVSKPKRNPMTRDAGCPLTFAFFFLLSVLLKPLWVWKRSRTQGLLPSGTGGSTLHNVEPFLGFLGWFSWLSWEAACAIGLPNASRHCIINRCTKPILNTHNNETKSV